MASGEKRSIFSLLAGSRREVLLLALSAVFLGATLAAYFRTTTTARQDQEYLNTVRSMQQQALSLGKIGADTSRGISPDFRLLEGAEANMEDDIRRLKEGDPNFNLPPAPTNEAIEEAMLFLDDTWAEMKESTQLILNTRTNFLSVEQYILQLQDTAYVLTDVIDSLGERAIARGSSAATIRLIGTQQLLLERISNRAGRVISAGRGADMTAMRLSDDGDQFAANVEELSKDRLARDSVAGPLIEQLSDSLTKLQDSIAAIETDSTTLAEAQEASSILSAIGNDVLAAAIELEDALSSYANSRLIKPYLIYVSGAVSAVLLLAFVALFMINVRRRQEQLEATEMAQQDAILRLLDEITNLADGDLTTEVTVTEDFTGAIADSINYTIDTLRNLVGTINTTAQRVNEAAGTTLNTANELNKASRTQAAQVASATESIDTMTERMQGMSSEARKLAEEAQTSLDIAQTGGATVRGTIHSMDALREQIQDTSKRIKRLGESSQEIGNIIEFINDISEQTNTLALNASIQAAMAGEAGKGFAVVADEVQRLAERAGSATKQIEGLVKTIQADTNEAIVSMERSTTNVVTGAKSSEEAGQALERIEAFAGELTKLIQAISGSANEQSEVATGLASTMRQVRQIAEQTADAADLTSTRTRDLTELSEQLRQSVSGFRLPEQPQMDADNMEYAGVETEVA